jgi:AraC-like DNA-binding protein
MTQSERDRVVAHERGILAAEGPYHVEGRYYANPDDADRQRRLVAERAVREAARLERWVGQGIVEYGAGASTTPALTHVATWLKPRERAQVDAAGNGCIVAEHCESLSALRHSLATQRSDAAVVSTALASTDTAAALSGIVRGFPGSPVLGLVADATEAEALSGTLTLGCAGVTTVIDARVPAGWNAFRAAFDATRPPYRLTSGMVGAILRALTTDPDSGMDGGQSEVNTTGEVCPVSVGLVRFFRALFASDISHARDLAATLGVEPSTLVSRFYRAGLPSPKRYLATARLAVAAHLFDAPGRTVADVAQRLDASSAQSFGRSVRTHTGMTAAEFRDVFTGRTMLVRFLDDLIRPYRKTLRGFDPTAVQVDARRLRLVGANESARSFRRRVPGSDVGARRAAS